MVDRDRKRVLELWAEHEELEMSDYPVRAFGNHLEYLEPEELEEVVYKIEHTDELQLGWHDLDRIYGTRARRELRRNVT